MKPTVADAMPTPLAFLRETDTLPQALERMAENPRIMVFPVLSEGDRWAGLVLRSRLEALQRERGEGEQRTAGDLARPAARLRALALSPEDSVNEALERMARADVSGLPVVKGEAVVGVLSRAGARAYLARSRWGPATFTAGLRGQPAEGPPVERWEKLLQAERSTAYRLATLAARFGPARRLLGVPSRLASGAAARMEEREQRVESVRGTRLGRFLPSPPRMQGGGTHGPDTAGDHRGERPPTGRALGQEIDAALELLSAMPFEELQDRGWHMQPNHFYWPLNDLRFLRANPGLWTRQRVPLGIAWDLDGQEQLINRLAAYAGELSDVGDLQTGKPRELVWDNGSFPRGDAYAYYGLVRELRPRRAIEVGAGRSSLVLERAVQANGNGCEVTLVEPEPNWNLLGGLQERWHVVPELVQHVDPELFETLEAGDILFYDGSHCVRTGSDVNWMVFEVLPRLAPGVWVHFHDIHWPGDYPPQVVLGEGLSWNEQYVLQAFLMHNDAYRVRLAMAMLLVLRARQVEPLFPVPVNGGSVWLEKVAAD